VLSSSTQTSVLSPHGALPGWGQQGRHHGDKTRLDKVLYSLL